MRKKNKFILIGIAVFLLVGVVAFQATVSNLEVWSKLDFGASGGESTSMSFINRFVFGAQPVSQYTSASYTGRLGILEEDSYIVNTTACGTLDIQNAAYTLNTSVASAGTCFTIAAQNVTLDCAGYTITYSQSSTGYAVTTNGYNLSTVKNCNIEQGSSRTNSYGLFFQRGENSTFKDNNITMIGSTETNARNYGVYLRTYKGSTVLNNNITTTGRQDYGIYMYGSANATNVSYNRITTDARYGYGIYARSSSINIFENNNITTTGDNSFGIYFYQSQDNNITTNNVSTSGTSSHAVYVRGLNSDRTLVDFNYLCPSGGSARGIYFYSILDSEISNNEITTNGTANYGIFLYRTNFTVADLNTIELQNANSYGMRIHSYSESNNLTNNNVSSTALSSRGVYVTSYSDDNAVVNNTLKTQSYAFYMNYGNSNDIYNNVFNSTQRRMEYVTPVNLSYSNFFNTSKTDLSPGKNIIEGSNLGGNYFVNSLGNGISQTCGDSEVDGICDDNYTIYSNNNFNLDFLVLTLTDNVNPDVEILDPENETYVNGRVDIIASASDNAIVKNVAFEYMNDSVSWTLLPDATCNLTAPNYDSRRLYRCRWDVRAGTIFSNDSAGYDIRATAFDGQGNSDTYIMHYVVDRTRPIIYSRDVVYPEGQSSVRDTQEIILTTTVTDSPDVASGIDYVQALLTDVNTSGWTNMTFVSGSKASDMNSTWNLTVEVDITTTNLVTRPSLRVYDSAVPSHNAVGVRWIVRIDNEAPTYDSLASTTQIYNNTVAVFALNVQDNNELDHYIFSENSGSSWVNSSAVNISGTSEYIEHSRVSYTGNFSYKFFIFDDAGNLVETTAGDIEVLGPAPVPTIYLDSPEDDAITNDPAVSLDYYYINAQVDNCTLVLDGVANETVLSPANETILSFSKNVADGEHEWYVSCMQIEVEGEDNVLAEYFSEAIYSLEVDTVAPTITVHSPTNTTYANSTIEFNVTIDEETTWCGYSLNSAANVTLEKLNSTSFVSLQSGLEPDRYSVIFSCNDTANNFAGTSNLSFAIDFTDVSVNLTLPIDGDIIIRGSDSVVNEDDLGWVENTMNITAQVYNDDTGDGIVGATCYFYANDVSIGFAYSNSTGDCDFVYDKSGDVVGPYNLSVNFSYLVDDISNVVNDSSVNYSLIAYTIPNVMGNKGEAANYVDNQTSILYFNITKTNETDTFFHGAGNITTNATSQTNVEYPNASYVPGYRVYNLTSGQYESHVVVNQSFANYVRWRVSATDDNYGTYIATALHTDAQIVAGPICGNTLLETGEECDDGNTATGDGCDGSCANETTGPGTGSCFPEYTLILMADGKEKQIKDVEVGEMVLSYDLEDNEIVEAKVLEMESPVREGVYEINNFINVTDEHPFYTLRKDGTLGWSSVDKMKAMIDLGGSVLENEEVRSLEIGDKLFSVDGKWIEIISIEYFAGEIKTYNLKTVDVYNKFFANNVLVHNKGDDGCTSSCTGKECGSDGCSGSCGTCGDGETCDSGVCVESCDSCIPGEIERECLIDTLSRSRTCGGTAECPEWNEWTSQECAADQQCVGGTCSDCVPNWNCQWTDCEEDDTYTYAYNCTDVNDCGVNFDMPTERVCGVEDCKPDWNCSEYTECNANYDIADVLEGSRFIQGYEERICNDLTECRNTKIDRNPCNLTVPISADTAEWCNENYVELKEESTGKLVSRIKKEDISIRDMQSVSTNLQREVLRKLDISLTVTEFSGYCDYCYDGLKNYDEAGEDCGGPNCPTCLDIVKVFNWIYWLMWFLWILLILLIILFVAKDDDDEEKKAKKVKEKRRVPLESKADILEKEIEGKIANAWMSLKNMFARAKTMPAEKDRPLGIPQTIEKGGKVIVEKVERRVIPARERLLNKLRRRLSEIKRKGYSGSVELEKKITDLENRERKVQRNINKYA